METIEKSYPECRTYTVDDIARILNIGRTSAYILVKEGHFKIVRIGNVIRNSKKSFDAWLNSLELQYSSERHGWLKPMAFYC